MSGRTLPVVEASIRMHVDMLIAEGSLVPPDVAALQELRTKARFGIDDLTPAEVAWITMLIAKRAILAAAMVIGR